MSLNIKNERVHELAREAARVTGKTQTGAIEEALVKLLKEYGEDPARLAEQHRLARIDQILAEIDALPITPNLEIITIEDLYDPETGLPR